MSWLACAAVGSLPRHLTLRGSRRARILFMGEERSLYLYQLGQGRQPGQ